MRSIRYTVGLAAASALVLALAACGDDDDGGAAPPGSDRSSGSSASDTSDYCEAALAAETFAFAEIDPEATPEEIADQLAEIAVDYRPLLDAALESVPDEARADGETLVEAFERMVESGDLEVFEEPAVVAAEERLHAFDLETCGWNVVDVTAREYEFDGIGAKVASGPTSFELTNDGEEIHHMVVVRINDGVDMTADEILELDQEEAGEFVTFPVDDPVAPPGASDYSVADLSPGSYFAACFIPIGTISFDSPEDGPPHFTQGMVTEFTVG